MYEFTSGAGGCARDAASLIFNLPGYRVIEAVDLPLGGRRVRVQTESGEGFCPDCGVASGRVHAWVQQRVKDVPAGGDVVQVVVRKPRLVCQQQGCPRVTFTQVSEQLPLRARCLSRLRTEVARRNERPAPGYPLRFSVGVVEFAPERAHGVAQEHPVDWKVDVGLDAGRVGEDLLDVQRLLEQQQRRQPEDQPVGNEGRGLGPPFGAGRHDAQRGRETGR